jgi:DNA-binding NarL/FixJ family response regulator
MNHGEYIPDDIRSLLQAKKLNNEPINPFDKLSNRELEITKLLIKGNGNLEISNSLNIQMSTVSTYKNRIFEKLKINNLVELIEVYQLYLS